MISNGTDCSMTDIKHTPVMAAEVMQLLKPRSGGSYFDGTLGGAGHTLLILEHSAPDGLVVAFDRDSRACARAAGRLEDYQNRVRVISDDFRSAEEHLDEERFDGMLLDLGVSSFHFDDPEAGFSFRLEGPLDMRMDQRCRTTAADLVNSLPEKKLADLIYRYGEERFSRRIATAIIAAREEQQITQTTQLAAIISQAIPRRFHPRHHHPATKTFQALRIAVNDELEGLEEGIKTLAMRLATGGVLAVISFHSLEDRIVKWSLRDLAGKGRGADEQPAMLPVPGEEPEFKLIQNKPILASEEEQRDNPRSRSAKLRAVKRTGEH